MQINPLTTPATPRRSEPRRSAPEAGDRFVASTPEEHNSHRWLKTGLSMMVAGGALLAPLTPVSATAAPAKVDAAAQVQTSKAARAMKDAKIQAAMKQFPAQLQSQVARMSDAQLRVLHGGVSGTTKVGPFNINNRDAFIKGSVMGKSVWGNVHQSVSDANTKWKMISAEEAKSLHGVIDQAATFSPQQRTVLADLLVKVWQS